MSVQIRFDKPNDWAFTNLDYVTGQVLLNLTSDTSISAINVKLEGESRSRLAGPRTPHNDRSDKKRTELEVHKLLYEVVTVFPAPDVQKQSPSTSQFTLSSGHYEYPFEFRLPFNNSCSKNTSLLKDLKMGSLSAHYTPDVDKHVRRALPPTLSGFPGEADIKYYVKATVVRPKFYQENIRNQVPMKFMPMEPPRPQNQNEEIFARRKQQFQQYAAQPAKKSLFRKSSAPVASGEAPPTFQVDARLPNPAILTCNEPPPLRILVQKLDHGKAKVFLKTLQIELVGHTNIRAHDLTRSETSRWVIVSAHNLNMPLGSPNDNVNEWKLPPRLWESKPLPSTIAPSFHTCNISRQYELLVNVGIAHSLGSGVLPELMVVPLKLDVQVYSGIAPSAELLEAMAKRKRPSQATAYLSSAEVEAFSMNEPPTPSTPISDQAQFPAQMGSMEPSPAFEQPDDEPPSYEDAMALDIAPVDGPRRDYTVTTEPDRRDSVGNGDSKAGGLTRRASERLFTPNNQDQPRRTSMGRSIGFSESPTYEDDELMGDNPIAGGQSPMRAPAKR